MKEFTKNAQKAFSIAVHTAKSAGHTYVGTEHLLYGLSKEEGGIASILLKEQKVDSVKILDLIEDLIALDKNLPFEDRTNPLEYSPRLEEVKEKAQELAERYQDSQAGTEHLLAALILRPD